MKEAWGKKSRCMMVLNETVQYLECEHGFVWASDGMDGTMQPRCEREKCMRWIRMYRDAVMPAEAAEAPGYDATGDIIWIVVGLVKITV